MRPGIGRYMHPVLQMMSFSLVGARPVPSVRSATVLDFSMCVRVSVGSGVLGE